MGNGHWPLAYGFFSVFRNHNQKYILHYDSLHTHTHTHLTVTKVSRNNIYPYYR